MVLGGGDGSDRLGRSITKTGAWVSSFPLLVAKLLGVPLLRRLSYTSSLTLASYATIIVFGDSVAFEILFVRLASDIGSVKEAFCVLVVELAVDNVLPIFDSVCCGD